MKASKLISFTGLLFIQAVVTIVSAQKAGDIITGVVNDDEGPMMMVNVTERDQDDRIVAHAITDMDGVFAFKLVNPNDRLNITYVGYETVDIPFDKLHFDIKMKVNPIPTKDYPQKATRPLNSKLSKKSLDDAGFDRLPDWMDAVNRYKEELINEDSVEAKVLIKHRKDI